MFWLKRRLASKLSVNSVKVESDQASAARLWRAARGAERLGITHIYVEKILYVLHSFVY